MSYNPLMEESKLPYHVPDWSAIKPEHIVPAVKAAMEVQREAWEKVATASETATVANTVDALEDAGLMLDRVMSVAYTLMSGVGGPELEAIEQEISPLLSEHLNAYRLDKRIFDRFAAIDLEGVDAEARRYVEEELAAFRRSGIELSEADKEKKKQLDAELSAREVAFSQRAVKAMADNAVVFDDAAQLAGLSPERIEAARKDAEAAGQPGAYRFVLDNYTNQPLQVQLERPEARAKVLAASLSRGLGEHPDSDTRQLVLEIAKLRAERAKLLGYPHHAQVTADAGMAKDDEAIVELLSGVAEKAVAAVERDRVRLAELAKADGVVLTAADYTYYQEKLRQESGLDDAALRPYLKLDNVVERGIFFAAKELFGITFKPRPDIAGYVDTMRTWEVFDEDGSSIGLFQADYFRRPGKSGGAWMNPAVSGSKHDGALPVILNTANFAAPADGEDALLTWDNVTTTFHEFGHALHGLLTEAHYRSLGGTDVPRDFVELPSQLFEMWAYNPKVLANFAVHHETGEPLPTELAQKLAAAATFGQAFDTTEFVAAALLDQAWHRISADDPTPTDVESFEAQALAAFHVDHELVPPRYRSAYFTHTFGGGYDAGYYSYMWAEVLVADLEDWFKHAAAKDDDGGLNRAAGETYRRELLATGNTREPMDSFVAVRGRKPDARALLVRRGLD